MFMTLTVMMINESMYTYVQNHQIVYINYLKVFFLKVFCIPITPQ